jgi:hypothetical protein
LELGWPQADHLIELRLEEVVPELDKNRKLARPKLARSKLARSSSA